MGHFFSKFNISLSDKGYPESEHKTHSGEVIKMKKEQTNQQVDSWITEEERPKGFLKPINKYDDLYPEDPTEADAYFDFRTWYLSQEHAVLLSIPVKYEYKAHQETIESLSFPFGSMDFERLHPFNKDQYKIAKIYERIMDLATTFSSINHKEGKENTLKKYQALVNQEFRNKALELVKTYNKYKVWINQERLLEKIEELNKKILACKRIWNKYAFMQ